ncbi:MAG: hypothetical protein KA314_15680 [Chloroflexi bacterium]|nr:hypothetical protein [Chloroflexota bacterium]MBP8057275.1 hypothetical protein [Chloroflexota bacterium]
MTRTIHWLLLAAANGLLIGGFYFSDRLLELPMALLPLPFFLLGVLRWRWGWLRTLGFSFMIPIMLFGLWRGVQPIWPLLSLIAGLLAYDLDHQQRRWARIHYQPKQVEMARLYQQRLLLVGLLGVGLSAAALLITIQFTLTSAMLLGLIAIVGLSRAVAYLRRESD